MVRLSDDAHLWPGEAEVRPARMTAADLAQLQGIGDRQAREVEDFLASQGVDLRGALAEVEDFTPEPGQRVEFVTPDGVRRAGIFREYQNDDALVQLDEGEFNLVAQKYLEYPKDELRTAKADIIRAALKGGGGKVGAIQETRDLLPMNAGGKDFALTLQYSGPKPSESDVRAFVAMKYPEAQILDGDDTHPGKLGVVLHFPLGRQGKTAAEIPAPAPKDIIKLDNPGIENGEIPGTGMIGQPREMLHGSLDDPPPEVVVEAAFQRLAQYNPEADFIETSFDLTPDGARLDFQIIDKRGRLDPSTPRDGFVEVRHRKVFAGLHTTQGEVPAGRFLKVAQSQPYGSGTGPLSIRKDEPSGIHDGDYVVKATESPAASEDDGEVREHLGGPGLQVAKREGLRRLAQLGVQQGDRFKTLQAVQDDDGKDVPAGVTLTVKETDVGRFGDAILSDGSNDFVFEPKTVEKLYMQDALGMLTDGEDPTEQARAAGAAAYERGFRQATKIQELAEMEYPDSRELQKAFTDGYMEAAHADVASKMTAAQQKAAVDQKTKDYYSGLFGDGKSYGDMLTRDIPRRVDKEADDEIQEKEALRQNMLDAMKTAWAHYGHGAPTPNQVFRVAKILHEGHQKMAALPGLPSIHGLNPFSKGKQRGSPASAPAGQPASAPTGGDAPSVGGADVDLLLAAGQQSPQIKAQVDRLIIDTIAKNPDALAQMAPDMYKQLASTAVQSMAPEQRQNLLQMIQPGAGFQPGMKEKLKAPFKQLKEWWSGKPTAPQAPGPEEPAGLPAEPAFTEAPGLGVGGPSEPAAVEQDFPPQPAVTQTPAQAPSPVPQARTPTQKIQRPPKEQPFAPLLEQSQQQQQQQQQQQAPKPVRPQTRPTTGSKVSVPQGAKIYAGNMQQASRNKDAVAGTVLQVQDDLALVRTENGQVIGAMLDELQEREARRRKKADASADAFAGRRQPAKNQLRFKLDRAVNRGDYMHLVVMWDPESCPGMGAGNLKHQVISFVKQKASEKDFYDLGTIGKPRLVMLDAELGVAEVKVRSSESRAVVPEFVEDTKGEHSEPYA